MSTNDEQRQNEILNGEESLEVSADTFERMMGRASGNEETSELKVEIPKPSRFGTKGSSRSGGRTSSRNSQDIFRHRSTPSAVSVSAFLDEDAVNPFELDLNSLSFASAADEKERDYYKPLPVADQMGRFSRLPSTFENIELDSQRFGTVLMDDDDLNIDLEAQQLEIHKGREGSKSVSVIEQGVAPSSTEMPQDSTVDDNIIHNNEEQQKNKNTSSNNKTKSRSVLTAGLESFKYLYSIALLIFCVVVVTGTIFTKQTTSTSNGVPPVVAFLIFCFLILWLATMEGGQGALVGLEPIDKERYEESHPIASQTKAVAEGNNLNRFIVGRQFLVVLVVFVSQLLSSSIHDVQLWGLGDSAKAILMDSGLALMVVTIVLGQLLAQLNAANCMLDFINNYFMLYFVTYPSLLVEFLVSSTRCIWCK